MAVKKVKDKKAYTVCVNITHQILILAESEEEALKISDNIPYDEWKQDAFEGIEVGEFGDPPGCCYNYEPEPTTEATK